MSADCPLTSNAGTAPFADPPAEALVATVVEYDDEPDECTIYPLHADEDERVTAWISAKRDSYVQLDKMR
ncbi:hypothetical protein GL213_02850 [Halogeometricum borinquense]|uniref:DUF7511 domain-containing protein n=1 Tax=Halogeometricum borinquense TaxID=60847 RepID=A0A6C0UMP9_9EURY|nr:hypothetical protein [Halogeometricum borinquense]QIB75853.1 hypothetical protein G3I44_17160 [Halogeometricum borinquense]QIQ75563.1 hypothetical protein GL213_02850 [Halogeometricum borinquense]